MEGKVAEVDVDPVIIELNDGIKDARVKLAAAQDAAEENWAAVKDELGDAVDALRQSRSDSEA